ncbi:NADH kinase pos5 [Polyrhizophydium stewartii]|uniref:NADH kinase pos5 n=1 Tax=Polyrhizophydium stewartii TaxID=2732419 RepID=A0ABR4MYJ1_9FUNG
MLWRAALPWRRPLASVSPLRRLLQTSCAALPDRTPIIQHGGERQAPHAAAAAAVGAAAAVAAGSRPSPQQARDASAETGDALWNMSRDEYRISWQSRPRNVLLIKKPSDPKTASAMQTAIRWLQVNQPDTNIVVEATAAAELGLGSEHASVVSVETSDPSACAELVRTIDFVVTLGGDGTILHAASLFPKHVPPILSFSLGSLGFLLPFDFSDHAIALSRMFGGDVPVMDRMRLAVGLHASTTQRILPDDVQIMNELTVHRGKHAQLTAIDIFVGSGFLTDVVLSATARGPAEVAVDGRDVCLLQHGQHIEVRPSAFAIPCVSRLSPASGWAHDIKQTLRWNQGFLNAGLLSHTS